MESLEGGDVPGGLLAGDTLVYWTETPTRAADLWYRSLVGDTTRRPIAVTPYAEVGPAISRDGRWIAYSSNEEGENEVYVQPFPPTGARYKISAAGGVSPVWAPDGRRLYYVTGGGQLFAAELRVTPSFAVLSRAEVFEGSVGYLIINPLFAVFDVSPSGEHFALMRPVGESGLVFVHDWRSELRSLTGRSR
jgi:serine/threonine-protein kinase